jgi:hypothetical protein
MSIGNCIMFHNTTVQKKFLWESEVFKRILFASFSFWKSEVGTNRKEREKNKKLSRRAEMVIRRGVDWRVAEFKVKKSRS